MTPAFLYGLVILSAIAHAVWNAMVKSAGDRAMTMVAIRTAGLVFGLAALPFVDWPGPESLKWLALTAAVMFAYYALLVRSYGAGDMSVVYPLARGIAPVLMTIVAYLAIDEALAWPQIAAVGLISTQESSLCRSAWARPAPQWASRWRRASAWRPTVSSAGWACVRPAPCWGSRPASRS